MFFLHNGTQLEGEKCKFQKLQNKDHPNIHVMLQSQNVWALVAKRNLYLTIGDW